MAEAVFTEMVRRAGLEDAIEADSAGTGDWHVGAPAHRGTRNILREHGIEYSGCGRQITGEDLDVFDYIVTMDNDNFSDVRALSNGVGRARITPLLEYSAQATASGVREVPDPYIVGGFDITFRLVWSGCNGLLEAIVREHDLRPRGEQDLPLRAGHD